jgi:hypothetical protein
LATTPLPKVDPIAAKVAAGGKAAVELRGYVGSATEESIRLYASRTGGVYVDIPSGAILHFVDGDDDDEAARIYVEDGTQVSVTETATLSPIRRRPDFAAGGPSPVAGGRTRRGLAAARLRENGEEPIPGNRCRMECDSAYLDCLEAGLLSPFLCRWAWEQCYDRCGGGGIGGGAVVIA